MDKITYTKEVSTHGFIVDGYLVPDFGNADIVILTLCSVAFLVLPTIALALTWQAV